jgi:hypothetical protein
MIASRVPLSLARRPAELVFAGLSPGFPGSPREDLATTAA